jgi:hypothetical protein
MNIALISLWFSLVGFAHEGGHGKKISEPGPNGGFLSSIILAKDASLGEKAPAVALAEWKIQNNTLSLRLLNEQKSPFLSLSKGELKWIILRKNEKPKVVVQSVDEKENLFSIALENKKSIDAVEAILPSKAGVEGKLVTIVFSNEWKH